MFKEYGELDSVHIPNDEEGKLKNFGYVCFKNSDDALAAMDNLNKKVLENGQFLIVN